MTANPGDNAERVTSPNETRGSIPADTFSARLVLVRHFAGRLSIEKAAAQAGLDSEGWRRWEDGAKPRDKTDVALAIANAFGIDMHWLLWGGPLSPSVRPGRVTKRPGEATLRYSPVAVRPRDNRPNGRSETVHSRATTGPSPRRPVRISQAQVA